MNRQEFLSKIIEKKKIDIEIYQLSMNLKDFPIAREILKKIDNSIHLDRFLNSTNEAIATLEKGDLYRNNVALIRDGLLRSASKKFLDDLLEIKVLELKKERIAYREKLKPFEESKKLEEIKKFRQTNKLEEKKKFKQAEQLREINKFDQTEQLAAIEIFEKAEKFFTEMDYLMAKNLYTRLFSTIEFEMLPINKKLPLIHNRGICLSELKQYDQAILDFNSAIKIDDNDPYLYFNRGKCEYYIEQWDYAIVDFSSAISLIKIQNPDFYYFRGLSRNGLKHFQGAIEDLTIASIMEPQREEFTYAKNFALKKLVKQNAEKKSNDPTFDQSYYESEEYKKYCRVRIKNFNEYQTNQKTKELVITSKKNEIYSPKKKKKRKKKQPIKTQKKGGLINTEKKASLTYRGAVYSRTKKGLKNINYWGEGTNLSKSKNDLSTSNQETNLGHTLIGCFAIVIGILIPPLGIILLGLAIFGYIIEETK